MGDQQVQQAYEKVRIETLIQLFPMDKQINIRASEPMLAALRDVAALNNLSVSDIVRVSLTEYLEVAFPEFGSIYRGHLDRMAANLLGEDNQ